MKRNIWRSEKKRITMHQNGICQGKNIIDVLDSRFLLHQTLSNILNENVQVHFQAIYIKK